MIRLIKPSEIDALDIQSKVEGAHLPYGVWLFPNGSAVLFNRSYHAIWRRDPEGGVHKTKQLWLGHGCSEERFFYTDYRSPRCNPESACDLYAILGVFLSGLDVRPFFEDSDPPPRGDGLDNPDPPQRCIYI